MSTTVTRSRKRARVLLAFALLVLPAASPGCVEPERPLIPRSQTWAELRTVRRSVTVTPPHEKTRAPYPRERLVDGETVEVGAEGLAWIRRDGGATLLVRGPAKLVLRSDAIELQEGRVFIDTPAAETTEIETPSAPLHLAHVRASIDVKPSGAGTTEAYVLAGEVKTDGAEPARAGERLMITGKAGANKVAVEPALAWEDWTGGLATTDRGVAPAPFGIGTVGARLPGQSGAPRTSLAIQKLEVRARIDRDLAITEVDQTFFNSTSDVVEGEYRFRTPDGATLHRFGVDRGGVMVWGRVKEKQAAAAQYQANVYQGSKEDPALLEWDAPGVYKARLYPIGPGESRRVVVRYATFLGRTGEHGERRLYVYPMAAEGSEGSLPFIEELTATFDLGTAGAKEVRVGMDGVREGNAVVVRAHDFVPRADLSLELFDLGEEAPSGYSAPHSIDYDTLAPADRQDARKRAQGEADYVLVALRPDHIPMPAGGLDLAIVIDTSAATDAASLAIARAAAGALLAHLGKDDRVAVWAGDAALRPIAAEGSKPGASALRAVDEAARREILERLATVERGGATDLGAMLSEAATALDPSRRGAIVYIGDAAPTVGESSLSDLRERLSRLPRPVRIFGLGVGDGANMALLKGLSRGALSERISDGNEAARAALRLLEAAERPALLGAAVDLGPSVERVFPRDLSAIVADESVFVVGRASSLSMPTSVTVSAPGATSRRLPLKVTPVSDLGDLTRRWAEGRLSQTMDEGAGRAAMVDIGVRHGIITPVTSLYVQTTNEMTPEEREELRRAQRSAALGFRGAGTETWSPYKQAAPDDDDKEEQKEAEAVAASNADNKEGGTGTRAKGEEGSMGNPNTRSSGNRYGVQGPADNPDPHIARQQALRDSAEFGMIGLLNSGAGGDPNAPTAPWGRDDSLGNDPMSARGNMWGGNLASAPPGAQLELAPSPAASAAPSIGDAFGAGGLGLSGAGEGGAGRGEGIGLGSIGTIGHGAGTGTGQGFGSGHGRLGGMHRGKPPQVRMGAVTVQGALPPEVVQRIVRQNFGRFRLCYENGLRNNPNLQGRVAVRFVIGRDGTVSQVANGGSDLPDGGAVACVVRSFYGLAFPQPESGLVTVVYPIMFSPGDSNDPAQLIEESKPKDEAKADSAPKATAAKSGEAGKDSIIIRIDDVPHTKRLCGDAAGVPFEERVTLWRERLLRYSANPESAATVYRNALRNCEAPTWRERARLLSLMLDMIPDVAGRVALWRSMLSDAGAADTLYRGMLSRVRTTQQARELHAALGLKSIDPGFLEQKMKEAKTPEARVAKLRAFTAEWPNDFSLALRLLDALEDANDSAGARALGRSLRARPDADARLRTAVGELYFRLAAREPDAAQKASDEAEARRAFGEIVEFAPDDPVARRRLGDLLRAHGYYAEAARQYETLAALSPDDASVSLLRAAAAEGLGKLEEALRWTEKGGSAGAPDVEQSPAYTARAFAATYLGWGYLAASEAARADERKAIADRLLRVISGDRGAARRGTRVTLSWTHPELHPTLWSNALGAAMPAREGDVTLGIAQVIMPVRGGAYVEVRIEPDEVEHAARLGSPAIVTAIFDEGEQGMKVVKMPVTFARGGPAARRFSVGGGELKEIAR